MADSDTSKDPEVPLDDEAKKLKLEAIKAEARKSIATAQQATLEAQLPKSDVTAPEGKIEAGENVGMVAQAVAYSALGDVAGKIAGAIPQKASVLIVDSRGLFATDWQYEMVTGDLADQKTALDNAVALFQPPKPKLGEKTPPAEGAEGREGAQDFVPGLAALSPTMTAAGSLVGSAAQLAGLFRSDYGISALATTIGATPLIAAVARELIGKDHATVVDGFSLVQGSVVLEDLRGAWTQRRQLEKLKIMEEQRIAADASNADDLRARLKDAATAYDKALSEDKADVDLTKLQEVLTRLQGDINSLEASLQRPRTNIALATAVAARFDTFATSVAAVPPGGGYAPIISAALREQLHGQEPTVSHVLFLSVDTAGAETATIRGLFRQRVRFVGGLHASYLLLGVTEKTVVAAGTAGAIRQVNYKLGSGNFKPAEGQDLYPNNDA